MLYDSKDGHVHSFATLMGSAVQVWEGDGVVKSARKLIGATNPLEAEAGTIRGDFAIQTGRNVVHGSDSPENGVREASESQTGHAMHCSLKRMCMLPK